MPVDFLIGMMMPEPSSENQRQADARRDGFFRHLNARPVLICCLFEGSLAVLALALTWFFGLRPWSGLTLSVPDLTLSVVATMLLLLPLALLDRISCGWIEEIRAFIRTTLVPLFRHTGIAGLGLVALAAGIGEELLFRGVVQDGLEAWCGPLPALVLASLLFGMAHCITRAYFVLACLMGLYLGALYLWTGNLLVVILVHAMYDWVALWYYLRPHR